MSLWQKVKSGIPDTVKDSVRGLVPRATWAYLRAQTEPLELYRTDRFTFYPVSKDPLVIYTTGGGRTLGNVFHMARALDGRKAWFILVFHSQISPWKAHFLSRQLEEFRRRHGECELTILAPDEEERQLIQQITGADVRFINKNAFTREDQFCIRGDVEKRYDAIMNARMLRVKRVELARLVDELAMITVVDNDDYFQEMKAVLDGAAWLNFQGGEYTYLTRNEVSTALNTARTGLILSAVEGTNRASMEYLLSGLPVVSTPSMGGRDVFFDEDYCAIVEPTAEAVQQGVQRMIARDIPPEHIRERTLRRVREHRRRFLSLASELAERDLGIEVDKWLDHFPRDLRFRCEPEDFLSFLRSDYFEGGVPSHTDADMLRREDPERWSEITGRPE
jgi:glycosyltransferase involved in cell wall biosynthesis